MVLDSVIILAGSEESVLQSIELSYCVVSSNVDARTRRRWLDALPYPKQLELRRRDDRAALESLVGLRLLAHVLTAAGSAAPLGELRFPAQAKPHLPGGPDFSISHSAGLVVCAVARDGPVGVDVERIRRVVPSSVRHVLSAAELQRAAKDPAMLIELWTAREAAAKAAGQGGVAALRRVAVEGAVARLDGRCWHLYRPRLLKGYSACLASPRPTATLRSQRIGLPSLVGQ